MAMQLTGIPLIQLDYLTQLTKRFANCPSAILKTTEGNFCSNFLSAIYNKVPRPY